MSHHRDGASIFVAGLGLGAAVILWSAKHHNHHPATVAAPEPAPVHTVIVHNITRVAASHFPLTGTEIVIIAVAAVVAALVIALNLIARLA